MSQSMDAVLEHRRRYARRWMVALTLVATIAAVSAFELLRGSARTTTPATGDAPAPALAR